MTDFTPESLEAFSDITDATVDAFQRSQQEDPASTSSIYAQLVRTNPRLALRLLQQSRGAESPDSYMRGVQDLLGPLAVMEQGKALEKLLDDTAAEIGSQEQGNQKAC